MHLPDKNHIEFLPLSRSRCARCHNRMVTAALSEGPDGFEHRTLECPKCGHSEQKAVAIDPMRSSAVGWLNGELKPPVDPVKAPKVDHGRMTPRPAK